MKEQRPPRTYYMFWLALIGFLFGLIAVAFATVIAVMSAQQPLTLQNAVQAHFTNPLLWFFDLFPVVMLVLLGLVGWHQDQIQRINYLAALNTRTSAAEIDRQKARITELERRKAQLDEIEQESLQTEEKISRAKRQWEATFDSVKDMIILTNTNRSIIRCNRATSETFNQDYSEIIGRPVTDFIPAAQAVSQPAMSSGAVTFMSQTSEARLPGLDGWYEIFVNRLEIAGDWAGEIFIIRDVTDRQQALLSLQLQKQYYESLVKNSPIAIVTLKMDHTVVECNPAFENLFGFNIKEIVGKELDTLIAPPDRQAEMRHYSELVARGELVHELTLLQHRDGSSVEIEMFGIPVISRGKQIGILALYHDIGELARTRAQSRDDTIRIQKSKSKTRSKTEAPPMLNIGPAAAVAVAAARLSAIEPVPPEPTGPIIGEKPTVEVAPFAEETVSVEERTTPEAQAPQPAPSEKTFEPADEPEIEPLTAAGLAAAVKAFAREEPQDKAQADHTAAKQQVYKVEQIEGIGKVYSGKLAGIGIHTTADLLVAGASRKGRQDITERSGISEKLILGWVNRADLMRLPGVGEEYSDLLELAGVDTVKELRQRNPENLHQKIIAINEEKNVVRRVPSLTEVSAWIETARRTQGVVTY